jgi:hypothetical protein
MLFVTGAAAAWLILHRGQRSGLGTTTPISVDLHQVDWANVTIPGDLCRAPRDIQLRNGDATNVPSDFDGPEENFPQDVGAFTDEITYGDLTGDGRDEAALPVLCANHNSTAAGQQAFGILVFDGSAGRPQVIGTLVGLQPRLGEPPNRIEIQQITPGRVVATERWYGPSDGNCCPSGRARDVWQYANERLSVVGTTVTVEPQ